MYMSKKGKKYLEKKKLVEAKEFYTLDEAVKLLTEISTTKFDSTCEAHMNLGVDVKHADQQVRATVALPNGTGKETRVIAFVPDAKVKEATEAGAAKAGSDDLIAEIEGGFIDFDIAVATPDMMKNLGKIAKLLGQKGLMPSPKAGTVTPEPGKVIAELKKGRIEFRTDKQANLHNSFGKVSFGADKLKENLVAYYKAVVEAKPAGSKGTYINSLTLTTTMGPGIRVDLESMNG